MGKIDQKSLIGVSYDIGAEGLMGDDLSRRAHVDGLVAKALDSQRRLTNSVVVSLNGGKRQDHKTRRRIAFGGFAASSDSSHACAVTAQIESLSLDCLDRFSILRGSSLMVARTSDFPIRLSRLRVLFSERAICHAMPSLLPRIALLL